MVTVVLGKAENTHALLYISCRLVAFGLYNSCVFYQQNIPCRYFEGSRDYFVSWSVNIQPILFPLYTLKRLRSWNDLRIIEVFDIFTVMDLYAKRIFYSKCLAVLWYFAVEFRNVISAINLDISLDCDPYKITCLFTVSYLPRSAMVRILR